jgi:hypothetical protein
MVYSSAHWFESSAIGLLNRHSQLSAQACIDVNHQVSSFNLSDQAFCIQLQRCAKLSDKCFYIYVGAVKIEED